MKIKEEDKPAESFYEQLDLNGEPMQKLLMYLVEEHRIALSANDERLEELKKLRRMIAAQPNVKVKTFPWPGASNFVAPIIRIAGDAVKARIVNTLLGPRPFWICSAPNGSTYGDWAGPVQKFMEWSEKNDLNLVDVVEQIADQVVYLGECPIKIIHKYDVRKVRTYNKKTGKEKWETKVVQDQPQIVPILLENWLEPWGLEESNAKPWNSHRVFLRAGDLIEREKQGLLKQGVAKKIIDKCMDHLPVELQELGELRKQAWAEAQIIQLFETHVQYDWDNDGFREEMIVLWSYEHECAVSARFNFFFHSKRPLEKMYYLRHGENRSTADGLAHLLWTIQEAISSYINQRSDNITIANTKHWVARRNAGIKKGEQIWPGKVTFLDNPKEDLIAVGMGEVSPQSFQQEGLLRDYGERLSGISDPQLGREFNNPRVAATTTLATLQEGNRRFDMIIKLMRETFSRIGLMVLQLYQQFEPRVNLGDILAPEDEIYVRQVLDMPSDEIDKNFIIQVNTSSAAANKETQRQGLLALFNLILQYYGQVLEICQTVMVKPDVPDEIKDLVIEMAHGSHRTLREIVMSYDITDPDAFLVDVGAALQMVKDGSGLQSVADKMNKGLEDFAGQAGVPTQQVQMPQQSAPMPEPGMQGQQIPSEIPVGGPQGQQGLAQATA